MKRRDFIRTTVGAGLFVSAYPRSLFARFQAQGHRGTLFDKIWDAHVVANLGGETDLLQVDRCIGGSPAQVMRFVRDGVELRNPEIFYSVPDHTVSTSPDRYDDPSLGWGWQPYKELAGEMRELGFTKAFGQLDPRYGIMHVVGPETGLSQPGMVLCAGDSHTCTHGAMGLISWGGGLGHRLCGGVCGSGRAGPVAGGPLLRLQSRGGDGLADGHGQSRRHHLRVPRRPGVRPRGTLLGSGGRILAHAPDRRRRGVRSGGDDRHDRGGAAGHLGDQPGACDRDRRTDSGSRPGSREQTGQLPAGDRVQPSDAGRADPGDAGRRGVHRVVRREPDQRPARGGGHRRGTPGRLDRQLSNSNRNYIGRQGRDTNTILASTTTVAASAIAGSVADVRTFL